MFAGLLFWFVIGVWVINEALNIEHLFISYSQAHPILGVLAYFGVVFCWPIALLARKLGKL